MAGPGLRGRRVAARPGLVGRTRRLTRAMEEALVPLLLLTGTLLLCAGLRRWLRAGGPAALELVCCFQLCACTHELWLLGVVGRVPAALSLSLTYLMTLAHTWTCAGALLSPTGALQQLAADRASVGATGRALSCQMLGAAGARLWAMALRGLPVSALHGRAGVQCPSNLRTGLWHGAGVEMACAFTLHSTLYLLPAARPQHRPHLMALVITAMVYAAGPLTGAMFNPAVALSLNFFCKETNISDNMFVYWLGPVAGMILSVALFDHIFPTLKRLAGGGGTVTVKMD
ncbi:LOW QUALITY PROTEIN: aquaporin-11 [Lissotriton helveticus]